MMRKMATLACLLLGACTTQQNLTGEKSSFLSKIAGKSLKDNTGNTTLWFDVAGDLQYSGGLYGRLTNVKSPTEAIYWIKLSGQDVYRGAKINGTKLHYYQAAQQSWSTMGDVKFEPGVGVWEDTFDLIN